MGRFVEIVTFLLFVMFVGLMTWNQIINRASMDKGVVAIEKVKIKQKKDRDFLSSAYVDTINHDADKTTNTVIVTLDASTSFDAGNTAEQITFTRRVDNREYPLCEDSDLDCTIECIDSGECKPLRNKCGDALFEPRCDIWEKNCNRLINDCECMSFLTVEKDYQSDCEYKSMSHADKERFIQSEMRKQGKKYRPDMDLQYSWALNEDSSSYVPLVKDQKLNVGSLESKITIELGEGSYLFECTVTDPYGFPDLAKKWVIISGEANDFPIATINARVASSEEAKNK